MPAPHLARFVARHGGAGAEWMAGIPGTVGGALAMNAGCYGGETWEHVVDVTTVDRNGDAARSRAAPTTTSATGTWRKHAAGEEWFVAGIFVFDARRGARQAMARMKALLEQRVATQPLSQPNAGSVFRNPPGRPCGAAHRVVRAQGLHAWAARRCRRSTPTSS